jgi:hypothetical protein
MAGTKTGNKGFVNPADGDKVYTMDPVAPGSPGANENPPSYDPGDIKVDNTVKDISKKTRITLGTYLSQVTKGVAGSTTVPNKYSIDPSTPGSLPQPITTNGLPTPLGISDNSEQFEQILPSSFSANFAEVQSDPAGPPIKKGKAEGSGSDGHSLLPEATVDNATRQLAVNGPVDKYTKVAIEQNRWEPGGAEFTDGVDPVNPPKDFNVPLQSIATAVFPSEEATDSANVAYELDLQAAARIAEKVTENNTFPVVVGNVTLGSTTTADGQHPAPLTPQTDGVFAPYLRNSYNEQDYVQLRVGQPDGLQKGSSPIEGLSGHELLPSVEVLNGQLNGPGALSDYSKAAAEPNRWSNELAGFTDGEDLLNPSRDFNRPLQSVATAVMPNAEAIDPTNAQFNLDLAAIAQTPVELTENSNNFYAVSQPDVTSLAALTDTSGYPAPLTPATNANDEVHASVIPPAATPAYAAVANEISKGKSNNGGLGGNELLGSSIQQNSSGKVVLPSPLEDFTRITTENNRHGSDNPLLEPEIDPTAPPANFDPLLKDVNEKGKNAGASFTVIPRDALRKIPSQITADNSFPIDSTLYDLGSTTEEPVVLGDSQNDFRYVENRNDILPLSNDATLSNFSKGKGDAAYNGHNFLRDISGNRTVVESNRIALPKKDTTPADHPIRQYKGSTGPLQAGSSRFSPSNIRSGFNPILKLSDGTEVSALKLAKVGTGLTQRASAEIPAWTASQFDPTGEGAEAGSILPSVAQLGILKVNNQLLSAKDVLDSISEAEDVPEGALVEIAPFGGQSWGSMTNASEAFDDPGSSIGLFLTLLGILIAITALYGLIALILNPSSTVTETPNKQLTLGSYRFKEPNNSLFSFPDASEIFGIKPTVNAFDDALLAGFSSFFLGARNLDTSALGIVLALLASSVNALTDATFTDNSVLGANLVTCRSIVRSGLVFAEYISSLVRKFQLSVVGGIKAALGILKVFRSSKFVASLNVFSALGDQLLSAKNKLTQLPGPDGKPLSIPHNDNLPVDLVPQSSVRKHRLSNGLTGYDPTLSWTSKRAPSLYLVPSSIQSLQLADSGNLLGSFKGPTVLEQDKAKVRERNYYSRTEKRASDEERKKIERMLDAEYVPFYFHDVRTNEIISFHAFLASLSDSYSAAYDSTEGFGRVEPVKVYKSTTRKIDLSFFVASTNPDDFDHMWHKINKLTTLVYPQYTKGKQIATEGGSKFKSPFSQLVGASPLVRIRLGDLLRSNYSRFALARLFGAADNNIALPNEEGKPESINTSKLQDGLIEQSKEYEERIYDLQPGDIVTVNGSEEFGSFRIIEQNKSDTFYYRLESVDRDALSTTFATDTIDIFTTRPYPRIFLKPTAETKIKIFSEIFRKNDFSVLTDFMSPQKNSIVKSFESSGGKGLAGFIESMAFDWYDRVTWEVDQYRAAPKMCKVTVSFSPIHDISPGIDHLGYNRAPIYPVGSAMASEQAETGPGR